MVIWRLGAKLRQSAFMARLYLVRHGKAAATWDDRDPDPGLNEVGCKQAEAMAEQLAGKGPLALVTSPLRRTRETAQALERRWNVIARVDPRIGEITVPASIVKPRSEWLKDVLQRRWSELDPSLHPNTRNTEKPRVLGTQLESWREKVLQALLTITQDTVLVTHFVAINVAVGYALGDDRVTCFHPENCSCTVLDLLGGKLRVVELGAQGAGKVL